MSIPNCASPSSHLCVSLRLSCLDVAAVQLENPLSGRDAAAMRLGSCCRSHVRCRSIAPRASASSSVVHCVTTISIGVCGQGCDQAGDARRQMTVWSGSAWHRTAASHASHRRTHSSAGPFVSCWSWRFHSAALRTLSLSALPAACCRIPLWLLVPPSSERIGWSGSQQIGCGCRSREHGACSDLPQIARAGFSRSAEDASACADLTMARVGTHSCCVG